MNYATLGTARPTIARVLNVCANDSKVVTFLNEAQNRLLNRADKPVGSLVRVRMCLLPSSCIVLPRCIQTVEAFAVCDTVGTVRGMPFEFIGYPNGLGPQKRENIPGTQLIDRGMTCAFDEVDATSSAKKIQLVAMNASDAGKTVILRYIDSNGQKVYSTIDGVVQEGEELTLPAPPLTVETSRNVATGGLYHVVKEATSYPILMYEVLASDVTQQTKTLAQYEPSETVPCYRKAFIPGLGSSGACFNESDSDEECSANRKITALVKLQHVPVVFDNDPLVIGNIPALKLMVMAVLREEQNRFDESAILKAEAARELDGEIASYQGDGEVVAMRVQDNRLFGAGETGYAWPNYWFA